MNIERFPHRTAQRIASVLAVSALAFGLVACDKPQNPTIGQKIDNAVEKTEQAAQDAKVKAEQAAQEAGARHTEKTSAPTALVTALHARLGGEISALTVTRPSLEDTYLALVSAHSTPEQHS